MRVIDGFMFKDRRRKKNKPSKHGGAVCMLIICNVDTGKVERKQFNSWDDAHKYRDDRSEKGRKYRINIEPI